MSRASDVIDNIKTTLSAMRDGDKSYWLNVGVYDDVDSFIDVQSELISGRAVGIVIPGAPTRGMGMSNDEDYAERIDGVIVFTEFSARRVGADERAALVKVQATADLIRTALLADLSRGGFAGLVNFGGRLINGTSVDGDTRLIAGVPNQAVNVAQLQFSVGWWIPRP